MTPYLSDEKRIEFLKSEKNNYTEPEFDNEDLKWTSKCKHDKYLSSLAPAIGESQLDYRERLKWDFKETSYHKTRISLDMLPEKVENQKVYKKDNTYYEPDDDRPLEGDWYTDGIPQDIWEREIIDKVLGNKDD